MAVASDADADSPWPFLSASAGPVTAAARAVLASARVTELGAGEALLRAGERWSALTLTMAHSNEVVMR